MTDQVANQRVTATSGEKASTEWNSYKKDLATPAVRRLAQENNLRLADIKGTGHDGRVLKEDVLKYLEQKKAEKQLESHSIGPKTVPSKVEPVRKTVERTAAVRADRTENLSPFTRGMVKTMTQALRIPHFGLADEIDVTKLVAARPLMKEIGQKHGTAISFVPFFVKAASIALSEYPILNATLSGEQRVFLRCR